jgi:hypothetical protein
LFKKIVIGLALVAVACSIADSGYGFGKYLKQRELASEIQKAPQEPGQD